MEIMSTSFEQKSSPEEIRKRFDTDVARFSNLETGQSATIDAPLAMELITQAAVKSTINIRRVLDIGCGAGNNTLKLLEYTSPFDCDLVDLSLPMLEKARERIALVNSGKIKTIKEIFVKSIYQIKDMTSFWLLQFYIICGMIKIGKKHSTSFTV